MQAGKVLAVKVPPVKVPLTFAQKFDQKTNAFGMAAFAGMLSPRTFNSVGEFVEGLMGDRTTIALADVKAPTEDKRLHTGWRVAFSAQHVFDASSYRAGFSRLEIATFSAMWMPSQGVSHSARKVQVLPAASAVVAARRQLPIVLDENHLRDRLRERMQGDAVPAQKFMSLINPELVGTCLLYLQAAKMEVFAGKCPVKIAIPLNEGLLIGTLKAGGLPETNNNMVTKKAHRVGKIPSEPPENYDHHIVIGTWIDYNGLQTTKERIYDEVSAYGDQKETELAAGSCTEKFLGLRSGEHVYDDPAALKMATDMFIRAVGDRHDRTEVQEMLQSHKAIAERVTKLSHLADWAHRQLTH